MLRKQCFFLDITSHRSPFSRDRKRERENVLRERAETFGVQITTFDQKFEETLRRLAKEEVSSARARHRRRHTRCREKDAQ